MDPIKPITDAILSFTATHPLVGWGVALIALLVIAITALGNFMPGFEIVKSRVQAWIARRTKFQPLVKAAIRSDIQGHVNHAIRKMSRELPGGWITEMEVDWVEKERKIDFLNDGEVVVRMRPLESQDQNFVHATYHFLHKAFFPKTKRIIPAEYRDAAALMVAQRIVTEERQSSVRIFEDEVLEPAAEVNKKILPVMGRYRHIDGRGFFSGTFLREIQAIATEVRFSAMRASMPKETSDIIKHIEDFIHFFEARDDGHHPHIPEDRWRRLGPITSYGFLLVARPAMAQGGQFTIAPYLDRVREKLAEGIGRLYVFGTEPEKPFALSVIHSISRDIPEYELTEQFKLSHDYRGNLGGVGALFVRKAQ